MEVLLYASTSVLFNSNKGSSWFRSLTCDNFGTTNLGRGVIPENTANNTVAFVNAYGPESFTDFLIASGFNPRSGPVMIGGML